MNKYCKCLNYFNIRSVQQEQYNSVVNDFNVCSRLIVNNTQEQPNIKVTLNQYSNG